MGGVAPATKKKDALTIGLPAAGGAVVGALVDGKKGAGIGAAVGGGAVQPWCCRRAAKMFASARVQRSPCVYANR